MRQLARSFPSAATRADSSPYIPSGGFVPPYSLPASGQAVTLTTTNDISAVVPSGWTTATLSYSMCESWAAGVFCPDYSSGGAFVTAGSGGHAAPDLVDAVLLDFTDATWKRLTNSNGASNKASGYLASEMDGTWFELNGVTQVPAPAHTYHSCVYLPPSNGGGSKGSVLLAMRAFLNEVPNSAYSSHRFDLATQTWSRYSTNKIGDVADVNGYRGEGATCFIAASGRFWHVPLRPHQQTYFVYLDSADATWKTLGSYSPQSDRGEVQTGFFDEASGKVYGLTSTGNWLALDINNVAAGWVLQTVSGTNATAGNRWFRNPNDGAYYSYAGSGQNIDKLVLSSGTVTFSQITLTGATLTADVDVQNSARHYQRFFPVPSISSGSVYRFCWWAGGTNAPVLVGV